MSTYAIGDLQGCYIELLELLNEINFDENKDQLWFVGDLINRGPMSLDCIEFVMSLGNNAKTVLGNHDLHLLAIAKGIRKLHKKDTLDEILESEHAEHIYLWIRQQPLFYYEKELNFAMLHAGLPSMWSITQANEMADNTGSMIRGDKFFDFLPHMYGNEPKQWSNDLSEIEQHRYVINCFTRTRYLHPTGEMDFEEKGMPDEQDELVAWYAHPERRSNDTRIVFGHWSTVTLGQSQNFKQYNVYPIDTGCIWGGTLTALRLEDEQLFSVPSRQKPINK
ncbi:MAG: symmetrical bis(5'-nucleosyl)-tetraphosphatase [Pseudomonadota bacterium]